MTLRPTDSDCNAAPCKPKRILVVDDDRHLASTIVEMLDDNGYEVASAHSGEAAIEIASSFRPHVLISDVMMGRMNGVDAALKILNQLPECKVLLISGGGYSDALKNAKARGFSFELLQKPVSRSILLDKIAKLVLSNSGTGQAE
jgi:DNA-binding NtrC family response regulator